MTTAAALADLAGKTAVVTGATSGLGRETALALAQAGARVLLIARNPLKAGGPGWDFNRLDIVQGDLASQASIRQAAANILACAPRLDILVNCAGTVSVTRQLTVDGIELTFAVNHLAYYLLTRLLLERLTASAPARIVNVASHLHYQGSLDFDDLGFTRGYHLLKAYARSKLCNVLFTREVARRLQGSGVIANAVHPGTAATNIWNGAPKWSQPILAVIKALFMISPREGASRITYLAASPTIDGTSGGYFEKNRLTEPSLLAREPAIAARLWEESARLTGLQP